MEDINDFWNKYWHKPKRVMANEFGHNESNKELALKFAKAYADHKLKLLGITDVVGQSEQLKAEDKDSPFADYLEKWYEMPRYEKVYDRKDGKGTDTEGEVIKNYRRAFRL